MATIAEEASDVKPQEGLFDRYFNEQMAKLADEEQRSKEGSHRVLDQDCNEFESQESLKTGVGQRHGMSRVLANRYGPKEAIILRYLAYKIRRSKNLKHEKKWYYDSLEEIANRYPYIPRSTLADILDKLEKRNAIESGCFNRWAKDRTRWYTMEHALMDEAEKDVIWFDADEATQWGICGALLLNNLRWHVTSDDDEVQIDKFHPMVPSVLANLLPYSAKTIERTLKELKTGNAIRQKEHCSSLYTLRTPATTATSKPEMLTSKSDSATSKPDSTTSKPDNNTHYKTIEKPFEKPFISTQAPPPWVCELFETSKENSQSKTMSGSAGDSPEGESQVDELTVNKLKALNRTKKEHFNDSHDEPLKMRLGDLAYRFASSFTAEQIIAIRDEEVTDQKLIKVRTLLEPYFFRLVKGGNDEAQRCLFEIALELMYESFNVLVGKSWGMSIYSFQPYPADIAMPMVRTLEENRLILRQQQLEECKIVFASVDQDKELLTNLAPAEKMRVLRNALTSVNKVGWPDERGPWPVDKIIFNNTSLAMVERFFEMNPDVAASELLPIIDKCVLGLLRDVPKDTNHDPLWYSKMGVNLGFFLKYLDKITDELKIPNKFALIKRDDESDAGDANIIVDNE